MKILSMSGFIPEQICDTVRFEQYCGDRNISHYCGYASDYISQVLYDNSIDGAVFPRSCDSSRIIDNYVNEIDKFIYQIKIPMNQNKAAIDYFATIIEDYKKQVENYYGIVINDVKDRAEFINQRNNRLKAIYDNLESILYYDYLQLIHKILKEPLYEQRIDTSFRQNTNYNKRVFVIGSYLSNLKIVEKIEHYGMKIVGDTFTESGRLISTPEIEIKENLYKEIAYSILNKRLSPSQSNFKDIITKDIIEIKKKNVDGVIFVIQKYCEAYEYLFYVYKRILEEMGIPALKIVLLDTEDDRNIDLSIEAFAGAI